MSTTTEQPGVAPRRHLEKEPGPRLLPGDRRVWWLGFAVGLLVVAIAVVRDRKWGWIGHDGKQRIDFRFDSAYPAGDGRIPVSSGRKWGAIDYTGKEVIPFEYDGMATRLSCDPAFAYDLRVTKTPIV